jgi:hypothetical protein
MPEKSLPVLIFIELGVSFTLFMGLALYMTA